VLEFLQSLSLKDPAITPKEDFRRPRRTILPTVFAQGELFESRQQAANDLIENLDKWVLAQSSYRKSLSAIFGPPGIGKSHFLVALGIRLGLKIPGHILAGLKERNVNAHECIPLSVDFNGGSLVKADEVKISDEFPLAFRILFEYVLLCFGFLSSTYTYTYILIFFKPLCL
jgi:hypothetical protein